MRVIDRIRNGLAGVLSAITFLLVSGTLVVLALVLVLRGASAATDSVAVAVTERALGESFLIASIALPAAVLMGTFLALYWVEYRDEPLARLGQRVGREMARLPDLFIAVALVALATREQRSSRALLCFAAFVPALVYVATTTSALLASLVPVYRGAALALGVRRHHWILSSLRRIALRPILGIALSTLGRILTSAAPLLILSPSNPRAPLAIELIRDRDAKPVALLALGVLAVVLLTKGAGRALLGPSATKRHRPS